VLFVTRDFPPSQVMGAQACSQIARYLPRYGWDPVILTVRERDADSPDPNARHSPGTIVRTAVLPHPVTIYRWLKARLGSAGSGYAGGGTCCRPRGRIRREMVSLFVAPDIYTGWIPPATIAGLRAIRRWRITHIISSAPSWTNHLVGLILAHLSGLPWIVHLRDPWTQAPPNNKPVSNASTRLERWLERLVMSRADFVVCVTERHTRLLRQIFAHMPAEKFVTIPNGYDEAEWNGSERLPGRSESADGRKFVITYAGSLYMGRSPRPLFRALRRLLDAGDLSAEDLRVDLFGFCDVVEGVGVADMAAEWGLAGCVKLAPLLGRAETLRRMAASDLLLLLQEGWHLQIPGKTYEYLRTGRPILALTSDGALADLLNQTGGAWVIRAADEAAAASGLREAYLSWKAGRPLPAPDPAVVARFDRQFLTGHFAALFDRATARRRWHRRFATWRACAPSSSRSEVESS
jgi:glycosyltransferase involved in cell wall biosynthesis